MYRLEIFHFDEPTPRQVVHLTRANEVLDAIPNLLAQNAGCARIEVLASGVRLFAVDCEGNRIAA